jgi:hypothetical protein
VDLPHEGFGSYFLDVFDRPPRSSACECARSTGASLSQVLHLSFSGNIESKVNSGDGRVAKLVKAKATPEQALEDIYLAALARQPTEQERQTSLTYLWGQPDLRRGLEDILWTLLNTREFMFNH